MDFPLFFCSLFYGLPSPLGLKMRITERSHSKSVPLSSLCQENIGFEFNIESRHTILILPLISRVMQGDFDIPESRDIVRVK